MIIFNNNLIPEERQPKLFIINASVKDHRGGIVNMLLYNGVHYSLEEAQVAMATQLQLSAPQMYHFAVQNGGGLFFHQHKALDVAFLQSEFSKFEETIAKKANRIARSKSHQKSDLMFALIGKGDTDAVREYKDVLSDGEMQYCIDQIIKTRHL